MSVNNPSSARRRLLQDNDDQEEDTDNGNQERQESDLVKEQGSNQNFANTFIEELQRQRDEMSRRYNFDFDNEQPLPGNYVWERVVPPSPPPPPPPQESQPIVPTNTQTPESGVHQVVVADTTEKVMDTQEAHSKMTPTKSLAEKSTGSD